MFPFGNPIEGIAVAQYRSIIYFIMFPFGNPIEGIAVAQYPNLEAVTLYIYVDKFILVPNRTITGIRCNLQIDRKNHSYQELDGIKALPSGQYKKHLFSAFFGILPILNKNFLVFAQRCDRVCNIGSSPIYEIKTTTLICLEVETSTPEGYLEMEAANKMTQTNQKILGYVNYLTKTLLAEGYYFSYQYELTLSREAFAKGFPPKKKFIWNLHMGQGLMQLNQRAWFVGLIQGCIRSFTFLLDSTSINYILITRRSSAKGGTRYNSRGLDFKGNVANFCETEQIIFVNQVCFSHIMIRGSVPAFWKQTGIYAQVEFYNSQEENEKCFESHMRKLIRNYGKIHSINLLCKKKDGQIDLTVYFEQLVRKADSKEARYDFFDVHDAAKGQKFARCNYLIDKISHLTKNFGYYSENIKTGKVRSFQHGVARVNCLDCLDRTNLIQSKIAYDVLTTLLTESGFNLTNFLDEPSILRAAENPLSTNILLMNLKSAWADNGDMISKHYTGTGSTHTSVTRAGQRNMYGLMDHGLKTCQRFYQQVMTDNYKQQVINILIGKHTETINISELESRLKAITVESANSATEDMTSSTITV